MDVIGAPKGYTILSLSREKKISFSGMCRALHGLVSLGLLQEVELVEGRQLYGTQYSLWNGDSTNVG